MKSKAIAVAAALVLAGTLPIAADAGKPVKPAPDNAAAYPLFVDANGKVVGPAIFDGDSYVVVRLDGYILRLGLSGLDNDSSYDFTKADWLRDGLLFEQSGCVGTAYVLGMNVDRGQLGFSARALVVRDLVSQRDTAVLFFPGYESTRLELTIRSVVGDGGCFDLPEPSVTSVVPVATKIDIGSLYVPPFTLK